MRGVTLFNTVVARLAAAALLWPPALSWLTRIRPHPDDLRASALTALLLAALGTQILATLFTIRVAAPARGHYRVVPSSPHRPMLVAAVGLSTATWSLSRLLDGATPLGVMGCASGAFALSLAHRATRDTLWETWLEISGEALRVHCPRGSNWSVPLDGQSAVHLRPRDGSFVVVTPWPDRDVFVPSAGAHARYRVTDQQELLHALARHLRVEPTPRLLPSLRRGERMGPQRP